MKEKILEAFSDLGFKLEERVVNNYSFSFENMNLLYVYNENDEEFFNIVLPRILELEEGKEAQMCELRENINSTLKYVKAFMVGEDMWLSYERELMGEEDLKMVITHIILHLERAFQFVYKAVADMDKEELENATYTDRNLANKAAEGEASDSSGYDGNSNNNNK